MTKLAISVMAAWLLFQSAAANDPPQIVNLMRLAARKIEAKDFQAARKLLDKALTTRPHSWTAHYLLGVSLAHTGQYAEARRSLEEAIRLNPKFVKARVSLGRLLLGQGEERAAIQQFREALALDPSALRRDPSSFLNFNLLGLLYVDQQKYLEARRAFERATHINPKFAQAHVNLALTLVTLKEERAALAEFLSALALEPNHSMALYNAGLIYAQRGEWELAARYLSQARQAAPGNTAAATTLATAYIRLGEVPEAEALIDELIKGGKLDPQSRAGFHDLLGSVYDALGNFDKAVVEYEQAARLDPADPERHFRLGIALLKGQNLERAIRVFENAIKASPKAPKLWLGLGLGYYYGQLFDEAEPALRRAWSLDPQLTAAYVVLGNMLLRLGRFEDAVETFRKAVAADPDSPWAYYYYARALDEQGKETIDTVIAPLQKAIALNPGFSESHLELGKALAKAGRITEAIERLKQSLKLKPNQAEAHFRLIRLYRKLGDEVKAQEHLRSFKTLEKGGASEDPIQRLNLQDRKP